MPKSPDMSSDAPPNPRILKYYSLQKYLETPSPWRATPESFYHVVVI